MIDSEIRYLDEPAQTKLNQPGDDLSVLEEGGTTNPIKAYTREINRFPLLTKPEEQQLGRVIAQYNQHFGEITAIQSGATGYIPDKVRELTDLAIAGEQAKQDLANHNLRLVVSIANCYQGRDLSLLDMIQEGNIGLMKAVEKFDYRRGFRFATYATWWIRQAITRAIADQSRTIRLPIHTYEEVNQFWTASRHLTQELNKEEPSNAEIAAKLGWTEKKVALIRRSSQFLFSLDRPINGETERTFADIIPDSASTSNQAEQAIRRQAVETALTTLKLRERLVLELRYGIDGHPQTLEEIATKFGLSRERIRQIEAEALNKLRQPSRSKKLKGYLD